MRFRRSNFLRSIALLPLAAFARGTAFAGPYAKSSFGRTFGGFSHNFRESLAGICLVLDTIPSGVKFATYQVSEFYPTYHQDLQVFIAMPGGAPDVPYSITDDSFDVPSFSVEGVDVDQNFVWLLDCAVPNDKTNDAFNHFVTAWDIARSSDDFDEEPLVRYLRYAFRKIEAHKLPVRNVLAHTSTAKRLARLPHEVLKTHHLLHGASGTLWGATLYASSKVPKNAIYVATIPEFLGVLSITEDERRAGMAIVTPAGISKIVLPPELLD